MKKVLPGLLIIAIIIVGYVGFRYYRTQTPEYALEQVAIAVDSKDERLFRKYVDVPQVTANVYDDVTAILERDVSVLHSAYPHDFFFHHPGDFMRDYMSLRRANDLALADTAVHLYFNPEEGDSEKAGHIIAEAEKFLPEYDITYQGTKQEGNKATAVLLITGHDTEYGRLLPNLALEVEMEKPHGTWQVTRLANVEMIFPSVLNAVETYWDMMGWQ